MAEFELQGMESMLAKFDAAKQEVRYKSGRSALNAAANFLVGKVKEGVSRWDDPSTSENIAKNVAKRWGSKRFKSTGDLSFRVGILGGAGGNKPKAAFADLPGGDTRHWRFKEFGTEKTAADPAVRPALFNNQGEIINVFAKQFEKKFDAAIRKANKAK